MPSQWERFKQSNIAKIVIGYSLVVWVLIQLIEAVLPTFETPLWVAQTLTFLLILGFPIALLVGWAYEKLPAPSTDADGVGSVPQPAHSTPKKTLVLVGVGSCAVIGLFGFYMMPFIFDQAAFSQRDSFDTPITRLAPSYRGIRSNLMIGESGVRSGLNTRTDLAISPDGNFLAYLMHSGLRSEIRLRDLRSFENERSLGEISGPGGSGNLQFSPDGEWVVFQNRGQIGRVRIEGGAIQMLPETQGQRPWGSHTIIGQDLFYVRGGDLQVSKVAFSGQSSEAEIVSDPNQGLYYGQPSSLPDNQNLLITMCSSPNGWSECDVGVLDITTGIAEVKVQTAFNARYVSSGHILFIRDAALWAVPFDLDNLAVTGGQVPVIQGVEGNSFFNGTFAYSVSNAGRLVYLEGGDVFEGGDRIDIAWVDKSGNREALPLPEGAYGNINLSPDQTQLAMTSYNGADSDIWVWDIEQEIFSRLTFEDDAAYPVWSLDGLEIIYHRTRPPFGLWVVPSDGTGRPSMLTDSQEILYPETVSSDGEVLFSVGDNTARKLYSLNASAERIQTLIDIGPAQVRSSRISPDGNWLLYTSNESGDFEAFVRPWPNYDGGKWQASRLGGGQPLWDQNSEKLYVWATSGTQYSIDYEIQTDSRSGRPSFRFQEPKELFSFAEPRSLQALPGWTYFENEDKFLMIAQGGVTVDTAEQVLSEQTILSIVENWSTELQTLAPPDLN